MRALLNAVLALVTLTGVAHAQPDFAGRWVLVGASGDSADLAGSVSVSATTVEAGAPGRPMASIQAFTVSREVEGVVRTEAIKVDLQSGIVGGVAGGSTSVRPSVQDYWSVDWVDDCLVLYAERASGASDIGTTGIQSTTEQWCMNAARQLVIRVRRTQSGQATTLATRVYRRQ